MTARVLVCLLALGCKPDPKNKPDPPQQEEEEPTPDTETDLPPTDCDTVTSFPDDDGDGYGDPARAEEACEAVSGWITQGGDCDDGDVDNWTGCATCLDQDGDGAHAGCDAYTTRLHDCDDAFDADSDGVGLCTTMRCYLPLVLDTCVHDPSNPSTFDQPLRVDGTSGSVAWGLAGNTGVTLTALRAQAAAQCSGAHAVIGQPVDVNNGVTTALRSDLVTAIASGDTWDDALWGTQPTQDANSTVTAYGGVVQGPILLVDGGCSALNGTHTLTGFAWGAFYDGDDTGGGQFLMLRPDASNHFHGQGIDPDPNRSPGTVR